MYLSALSLTNFRNYRSATPLARAGVDDLHGPKRRWEIEYP